MKFKIMEFIQEDFERNKEEIFLEEYRRDFEAKYWEWYENTEGRVIIENADGTKTEIDETINESRLPF